jgi:hypothetical protein
MIANGETQSDLEKGRNALREVRGLLGGSPAVDADLKLADARTKTPHTWVVFEDGQSPTFAEYRITFPVPLIGKTKAASVVTVALPRMVVHNVSYGELQIATSNASVRTTTIGSFDRVVASEFQRRMPGILTAAAIEVALKIAAEEAAAQSNSPALTLAATVAGNISSADTRSWTALPKQFEVARLDSPADGKIHIRSASGAELGIVDAPSNRSSIIYMKATVPGAPPAFQVYPL